jgi:hypothetical protein
MSLAGGPASGSGYVEMLPAPPASPGIYPVFVLPAVAFSVASDSLLVLFAVTATIFFELFLVV